MIHIGPYNCVHYLLNMNDIYVLSIYFIVTEVFLVFILTYYKHRYAIKKGYHTQIPHNKCDILRFHN